MKNIILLVIFCFIVSVTYSQNDNISILKTESIIAERQSKPSFVQATAVKADVASERMQMNNKTLTVAKQNVEKANTAQMNVTATATLATDKNAQSSKSSTIKADVNRVTLERQSSASNVKATAERAN